jgi:hypothetical protein
MNTLNFSDRIDSLQTLRSEHRLTHPHVSAWFAHLTPWLDDAGSKKKWEAMVSRYVAIVERWHTLTPQRDQRLKYAVRALCVREAMRHTSDAAVLAVCERVALLCEGVADGGAIDTEAFVEAEEAAAAAARAWTTAEAQEPPRVALWVKAEAARAAAEAAAWATGVSSRAWAAATSAAASWATSAAKASSWATSSAAARATATRATGDRLTDAILGACERELGIVKVAVQT